MKGSGNYLILDKTPEKLFPSFTFHHSFDYPYLLVSPLGEKGIIRRHWSPHWRVIQKLSLVHTVGGKRLTCRFGTCLDLRSCYRVPDESAALRSISVYGLLSQMWVASRWWKVRHDSFVIFEFREHPIGRQQLKTIHASYGTVSSGVPWNIPQVACIFFDRFHGIENTVAWKVGCDTVELQWWMRRFGGIQTNMQQLSCILIGCILYGMV